jgi:hypothetical protein
MGLFIANDRTIALKRADRKDLMEHGNMLLATGLWRLAHEISFTPVSQPFGEIKWGYILERAAAVQHHGTVITVASVAIFAILITTMTAAGVSAT